MATSSSSCPILHLTRTLPPPSPPHLRRRRPQPPSKKYHRHWAFLKLKSTSPFSPFLSSHRQSPFILIPQSHNNDRQQQHHQEEEEEVEEEEEEEEEEEVEEEEEEKRVKEAREVVADVLREEGVPSDFANRTASTCPMYLNMLLRSVEEIDEHALWSAWKGKVEEEDENDEEEKREKSNLGFREKVYSMAKRKGDRGIIPFLESIGLKTHSMRIAHYVSPSHSLTQLVAKVDYVRESLFYENGYEDWIGRNARRMMTKLSISTDDDIQRTLSFFEKMESRRGGLDMLGFADPSLPCLIESFPQLLLLSIDNHLKPLFEFLQTIGVPTSHIKSIILLFPPIIFYDIEKDMMPKLQFLQKIGVQDKEFGKVLRKYPWILSRSIRGNYEDICTYLGAKKVPKSHVDRAIKTWPHLLGSSTAKMEPIVEKFREYGVENKSLAKVIAARPQLLLKKQSEFLQVVKFLEEFGFEHHAIGHILCRSPEIFVSNIEETLRKKVKLLTDFGISRWILQRVIKKYPEMLVCDVSDTLIPRMLYLMEVGLSKFEVIGMVGRFPQLLGCSTETVLKPKLKFLLEVMEKPLKEVIEYPRYFSYSLEKKIKPRYYVLKGRNTQSTSLKDMLAKNDEEFAAQYMGLGRMLVPPSALQPRNLLTDD